MAFVILILWTAAYAAILASIQEARSRGGVDIASPPGGSVAWAWRNGRSQA